MKIVLEHAPDFSDAARTAVAGVLRSLAADPGLEATTRGDVECMLAAVGRPRLVAQEPA